MKLSHFILEHREPILQQWEAFARSLKTGATLSIEELRDDADRMLRFIAEDLETGQTRAQEIAKSTGHGPETANRSTAAYDHGLARVVSRFSLLEVVSEYRALRASVTRMWLDAVPVTLDSVRQLVRFNESVDQILAEGVVRFSERMDEDSDLFTGSVGHDLSNPVNTISMSARVVADSHVLAPSERLAVERIQRAAERLSGMVVDFRDFTRSRLGGRVRIDRKRCDLGTIAQRIADELRAAYADRDIRVECGEDLQAVVDESRIARLVSNLVANALQHGSPHTAVTVRVQGGDDAVTIEVHNSGAVIAPDRLRTLFDPLARGAESADYARLGLGLYIARQIAQAHGGTIAVTSSQSLGTRFAVRLPRQASCEA